MKRITIEIDVEPYSDGTESLRNAVLSLFSLYDVLTDESGTPVAAIEGARFTIGRLGAETWERIPT